MIESAERISYITDYIGSYETKIRLSNKNGLFDTAKLFELFAAKVCALWFGQLFQNLNEKISNYPYVDLLSKDEKVFVQVSAAQNIPCKIKNTLEKIKSGKPEIVSNIKEVYFFVLHNESIPDVKDYTDDFKIGEIEFRKDKHLITTQEIVNRAMTDLDFQNSLYALLEKDNKRVCELSNELAIEFENSKTIGLGGIDSLINDEYEIDRSALVERIKTSGDQFVSVRGDAGSGKSVICKKVVENESCLLFARAERFVEETDINEIWHLNIVDALEFLNQRKIIFFVDSLEFIADASKSKIDLLQSLYELVSKYPNAQIITSCRSCDETAFFKIDSNYLIKTYLVDRLSVAELNKVAEKYPIIKSFMKDESYLDLVNSPFYINLIVKNIADHSNVTDENKLRNFIWEDVICLKNKARNYGILFNDVVREINKIVFERAKTFSLGVRIENINQKVLKALVSENIVIENGETVRLKYDIFEDICFEQNIDREFDSCRSVYPLFFNKIEGFGRCCYRRYQIWISNKIFTKNNRNKFLYNLIFSENLPKKWTKQTIIGVIKSRFCSPFFEEQSNNILAYGMLQAFIDITNLYAFSAKIINSEAAPFFFLRSKGAGRAAIIKIIFNKELYKDADIDIDSIIKLCSDYAKNEEYTIDVSKMACAILEYYVDNILNDQTMPCHKKSEKIKPLLSPIYSMSEISTEWIIEFFEKQESDFISNDHEEKRIAEELIENTLNEKAYKLAKNLPYELCNLATKFWTSDLNDSHLFYGSRYDSICYEYGLNKHAENYEHFDKSPKLNGFLNVLFTQNFWIGLNWAIDFINNAIDCFYKKHKDELSEITINFVNKSTSKKYYASQNMWLASSQEGGFPVLLGDMVYILRNQIITAIKTAINNGDEYNQFSFLIKETIFEKSNNITLFSLIADIGAEFEEELPGYALDLATSMEIIHWDINRYITLNPCEEVSALKDIIFATVGVPNLKGRYEEGFKKRFTLQDYVCHMQLNSKTKEHCHRILDYLYSLYPNDKFNARDNLQIQKMDFRTAEVEVIDQKTVSVSPVITGEAQNIIRTNEINNKPKAKIEELIKSFYTLIDPQNFKIEDLTKKIDQILFEIDKVDLSFNYHKHLIIMISLALSKGELKSCKRDRYCDFWITGVESIFENQSFLFDYGFLSVLFRQTNCDLKKKTKNRIKELMLKIVCYDESNGLIQRLRIITKEYLKIDKSMSNALFNTIIKLAHDEYQHQIFNYNYLVESGKDEKCKFTPNYSQKLNEVDRMLSENGKELYNSYSSKYIEKYLFNEEEFDLSGFNIHEHDVQTLCNIVNTNFDLDEEKTFILKELIAEMLNILNSNQSEYKHSSLLGFMYTYHVADYLGEALFEDSKIILEIMFSSIDFSMFKQDAIDFYLRTFHIILCKYVDSHSDFKTRKQCESILLEIEAKINSTVNADGVKYQLYRSLILSVNGYEGDWSKVKTKYSFADVQFLNTMFQKYAKYNFRYFIHTLYKMRIRELLPYVLPSISTTLQSFSEEKYFNAHDFEQVKSYLNDLIIIAFLSFHDEIKQDEELTLSYEKILEILVDFSFENAAVLLDEFRIH